MSAERDDVDRAIGEAMTPETNHDVDISIYHDFLEDQGIYVDREEEEEEQWWGYQYLYVNGIVGGAIINIYNGKSGENVGSGNDNGCIGNKVSSSQFGRVVGCGSNGLFIGSYAYGKLGGG